MKKLLFGLMATFMVTLSSFGQSMSDSDKTATLNAEMVSIVSVSKTFYVRGQSYPDFLQAMLIPSPTVPTQDEFFRKVYYYLSNETPACDIMKEDNSILSRFAIDMSKSPANVEKTGPKKWWQILINAVINLAIDIYAPGNGLPNIDLWP
jgi:hypothetical protein